MSAMTNGTDNGNGGLSSSDDAAYDDEEKLILTYRRTLKFYKGLWKWLKKLTTFCNSLPH